MKVFAQCFLIVCLGTHVLGQASGWIAYNNYKAVLGIDAPVFDTDCKTRLSGTNYLTQPYAGLTPGPLQPMGESVPFLSGTGSCYFSQDIGGQVPRAFDQIVYNQLRAWQASAGPTFEAAAANGGKFGFSNLLAAVVYVSGHKSSLRRLA